MDIQTLVAEKQAIANELKTNLEISQETLTWLATFIHKRFPGGPSLFGRSVAHSIEKSRLVYWDHILWNACEKGSAETFTFPVDPTLFGTLADGPQFWTIGRNTSSGWSAAIFGHEVSGPDLHAPPGMWACIAVLLEVQTNGLDDELWGTFFYECSSDRKMLVRMLPLVTGQSQKEFACIWVARLAFMRLPFVTVERRTPPRADRRRAEREGREIPTVNVVTLRKAAPLDEPNGQREVDWQHSWIVSGHWRKQWYPSESAHKPVYISPYLKGDPSKPLLSRPVAYKVVR